MLLIIEYNGKVFTGVDPDSEDGKNLLNNFSVPQSVVDSAVAAQALVDAQNKRKSAYITESDPLYMEWQFDQTPESEKAWRDKVTEIKDRIPLPE